MHTKFNAIIFDLGNVIVDINAEHTRQQLHALGIANPQDIFTVQDQNALCDEFECGRLTSQQFLHALRDYSTQENVSLDAIQQAWEAMILDVSLQRLDILRALSKEYRLFLLSNTNQIHYNYLNNKLREQFDIPCIDLFFEKAYFSFKIGLRKPMREIFDHILIDSDLKTDNTLFIDDLGQNITTANQLGITTWHVTNTADLWEK